MEAALLLKTNATGAKENAVALQRARVEAVVMSRMTQDDEVTRWTTRLETANTANLYANTVLQDAIGDVTAAQEQMTTRAWIYSVMRFIDADLFHANCDTGVPSTRCGLFESTATASTSEWTWADHCNADGVATASTAERCAVFGIGVEDGSSADTLLKAQVDRLGEADTVANSLAKDYKDADYTDTDFTDKLSDRLTAFENW